MRGFWKKNPKLSVLIIFGISLIVFTGYLHLYIFAGGWELPKTQRLRRENEDLRMRAELLNRELESYGDVLDGLQMRDEDIYRSIFGLNTISESVRESGFPGERMYEASSDADRTGFVPALRRYADVLLKKAYVQSRSFDEIELMLRTADNMATSIPAIYPILPDKNRFHISSPFGYRLDPINNYTVYHEGIDFSMKKGNPVYATGDAVVSEIKVEMRGYGRQVVLDHGFGYKTRYAHLDAVLVTEGMKVKRGQQIATSGNTGRSTGPHLHYEVVYKGRKVNPSHYYDGDISLSQYKDMLQQNDGYDSDFYIHPLHRK